MKYLSVNFRDNDFSNEVGEALVLLWKFVQWSNKEERDETNIPKLFQKLHEHGYLLPMLQRLIDTVYLQTQVERLARGLTEDYWPEFSPLNDIEEMRSITEYLTLTISFHDDLDFTQADGNYENAWIELSTGFVEHF